MPDPMGEEGDFIVKSKPEAKHIIHSCFQPLSPYKHQDARVQATCWAARHSPVCAGAEVTCPARGHRKCVQAAWPGFLAVMQRTRTSATESSSHPCSLQMGNHLLVSYEPFCILLELAVTNLSILAQLHDESGFTDLCSLNKGVLRSCTKNKIKKMTCSSRCQQHLLFLQSFSYLVSLLVLPHPDNSHSYQS